jgi:hypothetical protein
MMMILRQEMFLLITLCHIFIKSNIIYKNRITNMRSRIENYFQHCWCVLPLWNYCSIQICILYGLIHDFVNQGKFLIEKLHCKCKSRHNGSTHHTDHFLLIYVFLLWNILFDPFELMLASEMLRFILNYILIKQLYE